MKTCPYCEGSGYFMDTVRSYSRSLEPDYLPCPICFGKGTVEEDREIDLDKSVYEYYREIREDAAESYAEYLYDCKNMENY